MPRWIWVGAWALAWVAGFVNVIGFLGFEHQAITHLTGTTTLLAAALASADGSSSLHLAAVLGSFMSGTILSGFIIHDSTLQIGRRYSVALAIECFLLCLSVPLLDSKQVAGLYCLSFACGLQNAMVSTYSGATVRTTHVSGMFTDLGIFLGHSLRGLPVDIKRLGLCVLIISAFLCGGVAGSLFYRWLAYAALFIPSIVIAMVCFAYSGYVIHGFHRQGGSISRSSV